MPAHKNCPLCGSIPLELRTNSGDLVLSRHNQHDFENWDCPLSFVIMEPWEWDRRTDIKEQNSDSPASPVQHEQAEISLAVVRYDTMSEFDFLMWVRSRLPRWRKLSAVR